MARLLTYNFFLRPPLAQEPKGDYKDLRLQLFIETELSKFDIICFQEVFSTLNNRRGKLLTAAKEKGFKYYCHAPNPPFWSECAVDGGLLIISRYPIVAHKFVPFNAVAVMSDMLSYKGFLYAEISLPLGQSLHLITTHT